MSFPSPAAFPPSVPGVAVTVPNSAPILPPQAFVDNIGKFRIFSTNTFDLRSLGLTHFEADLYYDRTDGAITGTSWLAVAYILRRQEVGGDFGSLDLSPPLLSGNALPAADIDKVLARISVIQSLGDNVMPGPITVDLTGGTNASPTLSIGDSNLYDILIRDDGSIVKITVHGVAVVINSVTHTGNFTGNSLSTSEIDACLNLDPLVGLFYTFDFTGGTNQSPTLANDGLWQCWTDEHHMKFNLHGSTIDINGAPTFIADFRNNSMSVSEVNGLLTYLAANTPGIAQPGALKLEGGTNAAPTGQGIVDKATMITKGWTVTTN